MNIFQKAISISVLRWSLGLVLLWESCQFALSTDAAHHLQRMGLPSWIAPALGGTEALAALLFLLPVVRRVGGYSLLVIFVIAALLHVLHGQFEIGSLVVYGAAVLVCMPAARQGEAS